MAAQGGVDQLVRKGKVRHSVPIRSWVRTLGKSSPQLGNPDGDFGVVGYPKGAEHRRLYAKKTIPPPPASLNGFQVNTK